MDSQDRRMNFLGDATWVKGRVSRKFIEDGRHLVEISQRAVNQDDELSAIGSADFTSMVSENGPETRLLTTCRALLASG